ncbi:NAD(P)/FAD-dependent oxidoreductase [Vreelandella titanicae]|uniref:FAD-binding oxidoreductase n=1 Tax=Vreelandella titanicae TaxID=664683 RepID=A0A558JFI2_9GAMM|nr:FAD-binding oxidoreductase [Halomonas titanicae]TVU92396.1 FAD-binding oxidoreductase [Halomonas titanicae]
MQFDFLIIGGGVVGMAVAYGLLRRGQKVIMLDEGDDVLRASRGNAGLTWVQGKGVGMPRYAELSLQSSDAWPFFASELGERSGVPLEYSRRGGIDICFDVQEAEARMDSYRTLQASSPYLARYFQWEYLDRQALLTHLPGLGESIHGGTWSPHDGHCNPLLLLRALLTANLKMGLSYHPGCSVQRLESNSVGFTANTLGGTFSAERIIVAAGLGAKHLSPMLGMSGEVSPVRGQILVTEKMPLISQLPTPQIRQTDNGSYLIGDTHEHAGLNRDATTSIMAQLAARGVRIYPHLNNAKIVRAWGALRVMTPDGFPLYESSKVYPGAYNINCHSGISLAAFHAEELAQALLHDRLSYEFSEFSSARFSKIN